MIEIFSTCTACGARNRIPVARAADAGRCGKCKAGLAPVNHPIEVDEEAFDEILRGAKVPVLVDFWASWCGPCRMAAPEVAKLAEQMSGRGIVVKVDTEAQSRLAARYRIQSIPNFMVFRGGLPVMQKAGVSSAAEMRGWMENAPR